MRIAILVGGLPPLYNGGTEIATIKIAEYASRAGHDVNVIAADGSGRGSQLYKDLENGFKVHRIMTIPPHYLHGMSYIPKAFMKVREIKPDVVHSQAIYMAPTALWAYKSFGIPYILYERGGVYLNWFLNRPLYKLFMRYADRVIAQTENQREALLKYIDRDIEVIPNGIDTERFGKLSKQEARELLGLPQDKQIVLSVGRCRHEKNLQNFVKVAKTDNKDRVYVLVGDGDELGMLKRLANGSVVFAGSVDNKDVPVYMSAADVLVNTSHSEGFPVSLLEGMASGLPIVAPRVCGIPEIIADGVNGLLTVPDDYVSTARAIDRVLNDVPLAMEIGEANKKRAREYRWETVVEKLYG